MIVIQVNAIDEFLKRLIVKVNWFFQVAMEIRVRRSELVLRPRTHVHCTTVDLETIRDNEKIYASAREERYQC